MSIALIEVNETEYGFLLLKGKNYLEVDNFNTLVNFNKELIKMLISTINTMKSKLKKLLKLSFKL